MPTAVYPAELPAACCLLPAAYSLLPTSLLPTSYLPTPYFLPQVRLMRESLVYPAELLPTPYSLLPTFYSLRPTPYFLLQVRLMRESLVYPAELPEYSVDELVSSLKAGVEVCTSYSLLATCYFVSTDSQGGGGGMSGSQSVSKKEVSQYEGSQSVRRKSRKEVLQC